MSVKTEVIEEQIKSITLPFYHKDMAGITEQQCNGIYNALLELRSDIDCYISYLKEIKASDPDWRND